ncbi:MAG: DUF4153 domain-containing protein [Gemmatimonadaceae bacterium]
MTTMLHADDTALHQRPTALAERNRLALATLAAAALLGVAGDVLVRGFEPGAGWAVALTLLLFALGGLARMRGGLSPEQSLMLVPIVFLAESFAWRDAEALHVLNLLALLISLAALSMSLASDGAWSAATAGFRGLVLSCLHAAGTALAGAGLLAFSDVDLHAIGVGGRAKRAGAVGRGVLLTLPLVLIFGGLLMSADPVFARLVGDVVSFDLTSAFWHLFTVGVLAWLAGGYLRGALLGAPLVRGGPALSVSLGGVEVGMMLGALNALFLTFLVIQARYLFGGAEHLLAIAGLTAAEYARSGFFELMFVAALALPVLLVSHELLRKDARTLRAYRWLAGALAVQVGAMLFSAGARMRLYVSGFGLTEDRLYASAVMVWLATVFAAFFLTVLRGRAERLGGVALVTGWLTLGALNAANPDVLIARVNIARMEQGRNVDGDHLGSLGAGAVPLALAALPRLSAHDQCMLAHRLVRRWGGVETKGWRGWNKARSEARALVQARRGELERIDRVGQGSSCPSAPSPAGTAGVRGITAPAVVGAASGAWWETDPMRVSSGLRVQAPAATSAPATSQADSLAALAVVSEWFDAVSFSSGEPPDWRRLHGLFLDGEGAMLPPRSELPVPGEAPHGMLRTPLRPAVHLAGDAAMATAEYELRHARGEPPAALGEASFLLRRTATGQWRLSRVQWTSSAMPSPLPSAP